MAKYLVTRSPGFPGPKGFVRVGGTVVLPDDAIPSRFFIPLDEAAYAALKKEKERYVRDLEERMDGLEKPRKLGKAQREKLLKMPPIPKFAQAAPEPDTSGEMTMREFAEAQGVTGAMGPRAAGKTRAADSK